MKGVSSIIIIVVLSAFAVASATYYFFYPQIANLSTNTISTTTSTNPATKCQQVFIQNAYRCEGNTRQQLFQQKDCTMIWADQEYCSNGCENGFCLTASQTETSSSTSTSSTTTTTPINNTAKCTEARGTCEISCIATPTTGSVSSNSLQNLLNWFISLFIPSKSSATIGSVFEIPYSQEIGSYPDYCTIDLPKCCVAITTTTTSTTTRTSTSTTTSTTTTTKTTTSSTTTSTQGQGFDVPLFAPFRGSEAAKINFVSYGDYQCPYCALAFSQTDPKVTQDYVNTGKVRFYFLDLAFLGPDSLTLSDGAWCANDQGLYYDYHDYVYSNQGSENSGWGTPTKVKAFVKNIAGLDTQKFNSCLDNKTYETRVRQLTQLGKSAGVTGTPTFLIGNGQIGYVLVDGDSSYSSVKKVIDSQLAKVS
jgi:protein-disulfide isomerase